MHRSNIRLTMLLIYITAILAGIVVATPTPVAQVSSSKCISSVLHNRTPLTDFKNGVATRNYGIGGAGRGINGHMRLAFRVGSYSEQRHAFNVSGDGTMISNNADGAQFFWVVYELFKFTIKKGTKQGVFYSVEGSKPNRTINVEWRVGDATAKDPKSEWHFGAQFYEDDRSTTRFKYWDIPEQLHGQDDGFVEIEYYRDYYQEGIPKHIHTGDVLNFMSGPSPEYGYFEVGPGDACNYAG